MEFQHRALEDYQSIEDQFLSDYQTDKTIVSFIKYYHILTTTERERSSISNDYFDMKNHNLISQLRDYDGYHDEDCNECKKLNDRLINIDSVAACYRNTIDRVRYLYILSDIGAHFR